MGPSGVKQPDIHKLSPLALWKHFIARRLPVHIKRQLTDAEWHASERWTNDYLIKHAGDAVVEVEQRLGQQGFGRGTKTSMTFGEFVKRAAAGDASVYLSTQEASLGPDGHPHLLTSPVAELAGDYPLCPALMGKLVPQAINMWMGVAPEGASSGLHHDFHDNLYILLRGQKRFRLYPPSQASNMYTHGSLAWMHPNGRIVYKGQGDILADGTDAAEVQRWRERSQAQAAVAIAEAAVAAGKKGAKKQLAAAERQLEDILESALEDADGLGDMHDDYEDSDDEQGTGFKGAKRRKLGQGPVQQDGERSQAAAAAAPAAAARDRKGRVKGSGSIPKASAAAAAEEPPNFSRVDMSMSDKQLKRQWHLFPGKKAAITVELQAGEMLYLPAGWFHEVTSVGSADEGGHLALNYWFHPPDHLDRSEAGFNTPYTSNYLPTIWAEQQAWLASKVAKAKKQPANKATAAAAASRAARTATPTASAAANGAAGRPIAAPVVVSQGNGSNGVLPAVKLGKRRVVWDEKVSTPPNKYRQSTTRTGTASGHRMQVPMLDSERAQLQAQQHNEASGSGNGGDDGNGGGDAKAGPAAASADMEHGDLRNGKADGDGEGEMGPEDPEAARAAVSEWMKTQPNLAKVLFAQFLQAGGAGVLAGDDDDDDDSDDEDVGTLQRVAVRIRRPPPGRRHHLFVSLKQVRRPRAPR